jgi:hypothetical protein
MKFMDDKVNLTICQALEQYAALPVKEVISNYLVTVLLPSNEESLQRVSQNLVSRDRRAVAPSGLV